MAINPDTWEELDLDELLYEELLALGKLVRIESRGLSSDTIASLPSVNYKTQSTEDGNNNMFEDVRTGWLILEVLDKVYPGSVNWKQATKPPIKMPFRKVENCNQVIRIGKELNFSLVNVAGNDIVQGNKKRILVDEVYHAPTLEKPKVHAKGKEIADSDILTWANHKVKSSGRKSQMDSFKLSDLSFVILTSDEDKKLNATCLAAKGEESSECQRFAKYYRSLCLGEWRMPVPEGTPDTSRTRYGHFRTRTGPISEFTKHF
ncbi:hypothetical protein HYC85_025713 [Camellia sinensis]|uniref:Calponin-homology (CH) domain-containing protein n=1 Tax=Camellia sinensis TaxID=4442 RepID=A0A7J7GCD9_CAMSI|nr:hypothetical protein HYC85_025713 [Camellia sinensis]